LQDRLPDCDALWLPGGYPELHGDRLGANGALTSDIRAHHRAGKPILAECGGMLYCLDRLYDGQGQGFDMLGILSGEAHMQPRLTALGLQAVDFARGNLRGHTFHFSRLSTPVAAIARATNPNGGAGEAIFRQGSLLASYVHFYFPSAPQAAAALFLDNQGELSRK
jgi:cobyrinic acid a,c-diamide synthase